MKRIHPMTMAAMTPALRLLDEAAVLPMWDGRKL